jgi:hypothetical protein
MASISVYGRWGEIAASRDGSNTHFVMVFGYCADEQGGVGDASECSGRLRSDAVQCANDSSGARSNALLVPAQQQEAVSV